MTPHPQGREGRARTLTPHRVDALRSHSTRRGLAMDHHTHRHDAVLAGANVQHTVRSVASLQPYQSRGGRVGDSVQAAQLNASRLLGPRTAPPPCGLLQLGFLPGQSQPLPRSATLVTPLQQSVDRPHNSSQSSSPAAIIGRASECKVVFEPILTPHPRPGRPRTHAHTAPSRRSPIARHPKGPSHGPARVSARRSRHMANAVACVP